MKKYRLCLLVFLAFVCSHGIGYAADSIPWDTALEAMTKNIQTIARPIVAILVAVTGGMVLFGTAEGSKQTLIRTVLGIGLALQVADFVTGPHSLFQEIAHIAQGNVTKPPPLSVSLTGNDKGINFIGNFVTYYEQVCIYGAQILAPTALKVLGSLTVIDMTLTLIFKLDGDHVKYLLHQIIKVGIFIFLIQNWMGGTSALANLANMLFTSFEQLGINATGATEIKPENILVNGFDVVAIVMKSMAGSMLKGNILLLVFGGFITLAIFAAVAFTALELIMCRLEFWTIALIIVPLIPFGAYKHTRFLFEKAIGAVFNLGIKMAVVSFICIIGGPILSGMITQMDNTSGIINNIVMLLQILFGSLMICVLAWRVPAVASGLFNGQPSLGGGDMFAPVRSAAGVYNMAGNAAGRVSAATAMQGGRNADGTVSMGGSLKNLAAMSIKQPMTNAYNDAIAGQQFKMNRNWTNNQVMNDARNGNTFKPRDANDSNSKNPSTGQYKGDPQK